MDVMHRQSRRRLQTNGACYKVVMHRPEGTVSGAAALGRTDLEIEMSQEVHSYQSVDVLMPEREHGEREIGCRYAEYSELRHVNPVAVFLADCGVNPGLLVAVSLGVTDGLDQLVPASSQLRRYPARVLLLS